MYSFLPRTIQDRTSYFNPIALFFNYESCYLEAHFHLRDNILMHRRSSHFSDDALLSDSSWFSADLDIAFEDVNANSYFLTSQKKPRQHLSMNDFRVIQFDYATSQWDSLRQLEIDVGDFLLNRNQLIAESRIEHLNDPMNYFFMDIKRIIRLMVRERNTDVVLDTMDSLLHYINYVETELSFDSQDRVFIGQIRESVHKDITPQIKEKISSDNLKSKFETLMDELDSVIDSSNREVHFSFQDHEVNPHAVLLSSGIEESDKGKYPLRALMDCAKQNNNDVSSKSIEGRALALVNSELVESASVFNVALLESCKDIHLMPGLSALEKKSYIDLVAQINKLIEFKSLFKKVLTFFDEVGQYNVVVEFQNELRQFLTSLKQEIETTKVQIDLVVTSNQHIKNKLLSNKLDSSALSQALNYLGSASGMYADEEINVKNFMRNQDVKHLTGFKTPDKVFDSTIDATERLLLSLKTWQATYRSEAITIELTHSYKSLIQDIKKISGMDASPPKAELPFVEIRDFDNFYSEEECAYVYESDLKTDIIFCDAAFYQVSVYPKFEQLPVYYSGDTFSIDQCQSKVTNGEQGLFCQGEYSTLFYQSNDLAMAPKFFEQLGGQVALGMVLFKLGKNTYEWLFKEADLSFNRKIEVESFILEKDPTLLNLRNFPLALSGGTEPVLPMQLFQYDTNRNVPLTFFQSAPILMDDNVITNEFDESENARTLHL